MEFLEELAARGLIAEVTDRAGLAELLAREQISVYAGYDPTSASLHIGNLVPTILLKRFQLAGFRPIVVVGGATGMIGDPSGQSDERNLLDDATLGANVAGIRGQLSRLLDFDGASSARIMNNADWTRGVSFLEFLRDTGKHLTVNYMTAKDSVRARMNAPGLVVHRSDGEILHADARIHEIFGYDSGELRGKNLGSVMTPELVGHRKDGSDVAVDVHTDTGHADIHVSSVRERGRAGISYTEFSYMLLQAFDFVELARAHNCRVQVGGSDQYGNITAGCELAHKMGRDRIFGLVAPLLLDAGGKKMGKTSTGDRIWLDPARTGAYTFYQYWFNRPDDEVPRLLRMFSLEPLPAIVATLARHDADRSQRIAQRELARVMTAWVHGADAIPRVEAASRVMFGEGALSGLKDADLAELAAIVPAVEVPRNELEAGIGILDLFARATLAESKGAARRLVSQKGAYLNNEVVGDVDRKVTLADLATETMLVLRSGKHKHRLVRVV